MFCLKCGKPLEDNWVQCPYCGAKSGEMSSNEEIQNSQEKMQVENPLGLIEIENLQESNKFGVPPMPMNVNNNRRKNRKSKKKIIGIVIGIIIALAVIALGLFVAFTLKFNSLDKKALVAVQNGYLGNYDTISVNEVFMGMNKNATWDGGRSDDKKIIIEYACEEVGTRIQFTVAEDYQKFKVTGMMFEGKTYSKASDIKEKIDSMYSDYLTKNPDKGIILDISFENDSLKGSVGALKKVANSELYNIDLGECIKLSKKELEEKGIRVDDEEGLFYNEDMSIMISRSEYDNINNIFIGGSRHLSPSLFGIRLGDNKDKVLEKLKDNYTINPDTSLDAPKLGIKRIILEENNTKNVLVLGFDSEVLKINEIDYQIDTTEDDKAKEEAKKEKERKEREKREEEERKEREEEERRARELEESLKSPEQKYKDLCSEVDFYNTIPEEGDFVTFEGVVEGQCAFLEVRAPGFNELIKVYYDFYKYEISDGSRVKVYTNDFCWLDDYLGYRCNAEYVDVIDY